MLRRATTAIAVGLTLALTPTAAFAGGAGDEQYQDPLAAPTTPSKTTKKQATTTTTTTTPATSTPAATTAPASTTTTPTSSTPGASSSSPDELPRTGSPAGMIGLAGAGLIVVGGALRRRAVTQ